MIKMCSCPYCGTSLQLLKDKYGYESITGCPICGSDFRIVKEYCEAHEKDMKHV